MTVLSSNLIILSSFSPRWFLMRSSHGRSRIILEEVYNRKEILYTYINFIPRQTDRLIIGHLMPSSIVCTNAVEVESSWERQLDKVEITSLGIGIGTFQKHF